MPQHKIRDPLIQQIGLTLKTELESSGTDSRLYADAMATALSAHLVPAILYPAIAPERIYRWLTTS
ncbi:hypothetical protein NDA01_24875 [Trichocoleus desertorum AS-A10]|uniref:hypothetical protein n=1 Tax=Trichocoleus desertorum TaxID=1481672 RepID=UPI003298A87F